MGGAVLGISTGYDKSARLSINLDYGVVSSRRFHKSFAFVFNTSNFLLLIRIGYRNLVLVRNRPAFHSFGDPPAIRILFQNYPLDVNPRGGEVRVIKRLLRLDKAAGLLSD